MLVLRKSLFSRQVEARKIAVMGYLLVLEKFKIVNTMLPSSQPLSQSLHLSQQVEVDVHCRPDAAANEVLCLEILGNLRRCFSQPCDVRQVLYEGLCNVLRLNSQLGGHILQLLYKQFERHYEPDEDVLPPVKLAPCVSGCGSEIILSEPLAYLVSCLQLCLIKCDYQTLEEESSGCDDAEIIIEQCKKTLVSLTKRILKCELEDFELDKSSDFCHANSVGMKNTLFAEQLLGIYEALIEFNFLSCGFSIESSEVITQLFDAHQMLASLLQEKCTAAGRGKGRPSSSSSKQSVTPKSYLSLNCVTKLLDAFYSDSTPSHQQSLSVLRENQQFTQYIVSLAVLKVHQIQDFGTCDGAFAEHPSLLFDKCCIIGKNLFKRFTSDYPLMEQRDKGKSLVSHCLDGYCLLVNAVCARYPERLVQFLTHSSSDVPPTAVMVTPNSQHNLHQHVKKLQKVVVATLSDDEGPFRSREVAMVVSLISILSQRLQQDSAELHQVLGWCQKICTEQNIDDHGLAKAMVKLLLSLTLQLKSGTSLVSIAT
jgi:Fanconi anemia group I protein